MESCISKKISWKPFLRQILICTGVWASYFVYGLSIGAPTVFVPQIRREANTTEAISDEMASWLTAALSFSGFPCVFVLSICTKYFGRKISFIIATADAFAGFIVFYYSKNVTQILISEIMQGLFAASQIVVSVLILTEYTSPRYRGLFLTIKSATFYWGIWASNAIGTFFHWKKIGLLGIICLLYTLVIVAIWPESPYWLASRGRFEACAASHRWLKGCDEESEKELKNLIKTHIEYIKSSTNSKLSTRMRIVNFFVTIKSKEFYKPTLIAFLTGFLGVVSGKLVCTVYAIDILKKITKSESTAYMGMLILDGITVLSMYFGCALTKILKRRPLLLVSSSIGIIFLFTISLYLYLIKLSIISENKYVSIFLLTVYSISVSCGPLIISTSICGELVPIQSRNLAICVIAITGKLVVGTALKIAPSIFKSFGTHGSFLFFGILSLICILLIYMYLPETKDKTLQEIADTINGIKLKSPEESLKLMRAKNSEEPLHKNNYFS